MQQTKAYISKPIKSKRPLHPASSNQFLFLDSQKEAPDSDQGLLSLLGQVDCYDFIVYLTCDFSLTLNKYSCYFTICVCFQLFEQTHIHTQTWRHLVKSEIMRQSVPESFLWSVISVLSGAICICLCSNLFYFHSVAVIKKTLIKSNLWRRGFI